MLERETSPRLVGKALSVKSALAFSNATTFLGGLAGSYRIDYHCIKGYSWAFDALIKRLHR